MKVTEVTKGLFWLKFGTPRAAAKTFLRVQEHFESPAFRGKIFTVKQYQKWFRQQFNAEYYDSYEGFNVPSYVLKPFIQGKFDPLNQAEKKLVALFQTRKGKYYIVASARGDNLTLKHELAHGLYYLNDEYRKAVKKMLSKINIKNVIKFLEKDGYHPAVCNDEANAYLMCDQDYMKNGGVKLRIPADTGYKLQLLFDKYFNPLGRALPRPS